MTIDDVWNLNSFPIKQIYQQLRGVFQKVTWRKLVCNNLGCPKWIFILTLVANERIHTRDRLEKWGITNDTECPLCENAVESIDHLFFSCRFSQAIWRRLLKWQRINRQPMQWSDELNWAVTNASGNSIAAQIFRIVLAGTVYFVWQERNQRIFQAKHRASNQTNHSRCSLSRE
ncbi:uncharacterized protein LOC132613105 [Lycium barbarum]|uniref:uncharacterized protein LOC132613105 n=1 Tax=Lycium barbarum TaxID=112863 RepID=UPI00293E3EFE|nr:uncharacterized protein LOC132613105 [Lycium barbarum]